MTFGELINLLEAVKPEAQVFGRIQIGTADLDYVLRYDSGHELPTELEFSEELV
jgi:hypothetical protein